MSGWIVKYRITGIEGEKATQEYASLAEAEYQAHDIRGYEGVEYAVVSEGPAAPACPEPASAQAPAS